MLCIIFKFSVVILCVKLIFSIVLIRVCVVEIGKFVFDVSMMVEVVVSWVVKLWFGVNFVMLVLMVVIIL